VPLFTDSVQSALERAMDGVALRQRVSSQNVSNAMTPGYQAQRVEFEGALSAALSDGTSPADVTPTVSGTGAPSKEDGNNVELETEATGLVRDGLQFEALVHATNYRLNVLRAAVR
jgi:flagellar basal-body rod protein FlgB